MQSKKRIVLGASLLAVSMVSLAAPKGFYLSVMGGAANFGSGGLKSSNLSTAFNENTGETVGFLKYTEGNIFDYVGQATLGYFFYRDPSDSYSFGLAADAFYFGPRTSSVTSNVSKTGVPGADSLKVNSKQDFSAWQTDLEGVYAQDLTKKLTLFLKLGAGFMQVDKKITNELVPSGTDFGIPTTIKDNENSVGGAGGIGLQYNLTSHLGLVSELSAFYGTHDVNDVALTVGLSVGKFNA